MKDLDFDELDRAVNSLNTSAPVSNTTNPQQQVPAEPTGAPFAGRPGTGRFMDVVHPSSNMRANQDLPERAPRQDLMVTPATDKITETSSTPVSTSPKPSNEWPDPIDFQKADNDVAGKKEEPTADDEDADINLISNDIANSMGQNTSDSPDSPFISGTKVDKRPLGAFSVEQPTQYAEKPAKEDVPDKAISAINSMIGPKPTHVDEPLPAELGDDLLSIESDTTTHPNAPSPAEMPVNTTAPTVSAQATPSSTANSQPAATMSIPQQYKEQPSSGDQTSGAIYDTNAYHKALLHPAKKKSGWLWVLWIAILLAVGAGAGVAVYFFVLR